MQLQLAAQSDIWHSSRPGSCAAPAAAAPARTLYFLTCSNASDTVCTPSVACTRVPLSADYSCACEPARAARRSYLFYSKYSCIKNTAGINFAMSTSLLLCATLCAATVSAGTGAVLATAAAAAVAAQPPTTMMASTAHSGSALPATSTAVRGLQLQEAVEHVRRRRATIEGGAGPYAPAVIHVAPGVHWLSEPLVLRGTPLGCSAVRSRVRGLDRATGTGASSRGLQLPMHTMFV